LKTASDDASTLASAREYSERADLPDGESTASTGIDDTEFDFDFEIINTAAYRKVFNVVRRMISGKRVEIQELQLPILPEIPQTDPLLPFHTMSSMTEVPADQGYKFTFSPTTTLSQNLRSEHMSSDNFIDSESGIDASQQKHPHFETQKIETQNHPKPPREGRIVQFGDYVLGQTLGKGQKSKVKLAWKRGDTHRVVVKLVRCKEDPMLLPKIYREASILRDLAHPNVVRLHEMIETEKHLAFVLDHASGGELEAYIATHRYLKDNVARRLFAQVVSGIGYLHRKGILHLALSCKKVLLDSNRNAVVTGFSHANTFNPQDELSAEEEFSISNESFVHEHRLDRQNEYGHMRGDLMLDRLEQPYYSAPEGTLFHSYAGRKADVWSCGIILVSAHWTLSACTNVIKYFMLAGYLPFADDPANPEGDNAQLRISYILTIPLVFPEYVTPHARDLLRRVLVPRAERRADLFEIARHSWLAEYHHVFSHILPNSGESSG